MLSAQLSTWLLGIVGYAGLFGSFALFYLYPNFPRNYLPALFIIPIASAAALYLFFQILYLILDFVILVLSSMLDENLTIILLSLTLFGGQIILLSYVVYKNNFLNRIVLNNAVDETDELEPEPEPEPEVHDGEEAENEGETEAAKCAGCTDDCTKCSIPEVALGGEVVHNVVCEDGVCRLVPSSPVKEDVKMD